MTPAKPARPTTRNTLLSATQDIHLRLHRDAVLGRLTTKDITFAQYLTALRVFSAFFQGIEQERCRQGSWPQFTLSRECEALRWDLGGEAGTASTLTLTNETTLLGALYVAHGAGFGRSAVRETVTTALPDASHRFFGMKCSARDWRKLVSTLEENGYNARGQSELARGAKAGFAAVGQIAQRMKQNG